MHWFGRSTNRSDSRVGRRVSRYRPSVEDLEGRCLPSVTSIHFDDVAAGTLLNNHYSGVTLSNPVPGSDGNVYALSSPLAASAPNVVGIRDSSGTLDAFYDARFGAVKAQFAKPQVSVRIDALPVLPPEYLGPVQNQPFLEAFDPAGNFLGEVLYPYAYGSAQYGSWATLTFTWASANIGSVIFSSQNDYPGTTHVYGAFDNLQAKDAPQGAASSFRVTTVGSTTIGYLGTIHFTITDLYTTRPTDYTFAAGDTGKHSFTLALWQPRSGRCNLP